MSSSAASPSQVPPKVVAALVQAMLLCAVQERLEPNELLQQAGLALSEIEPPNQLVSSDKVLALVRAIHRQRPDLSLGLMMGMKISTPHMGLLGHVLASAPTFGRALQVFVMCQRFLNGGLLGWEVSSESGRCAVRLVAHADVADIPWILEAPITLILKLARELTGEHVLPIQVLFRHPPPRDFTQHERFYGMPVCWSAGTNEIVFAETILGLPVRTSSQSLFPGLLNALAAQPPITPPPSPVVRNTIAQIEIELEHGAPDKVAISRALGMAPSTLFRRLRQAGTSFEVLVERIRRERALAYLADATIAITRVAALVGYSEHSAFYRAFVRWFGCTPAEYRASHPPRA